MKDISRGCFTTMPPPKNKTGRLTVEAHKTDCTGNQKKHDTSGITYHTTDYDWPLRPTIWRIGHNLGFSSPYDRTNIRTRCRYRVSCICLSSSAGAISTSVVSQSSLEQHLLLLLAGEPSPFVYKSLPDLFIHRFFSLALLSELISTCRVCPVFRLSLNFVSFFLLLFDIFFPSGFSFRFFFLSFSTVFSCVGIFSSGMLVLGSYLSIVNTGVYSMPSLISRTAQGQLMVGSKAEQRRVEQ